MKSKLLILLLITLFSSSVFAWSPDTSKIFWNRDFLIEGSYGISYVNMYNLNKYYLEDWAKQMGYFNSSFHWNTYLSPEFGFIFTDNIVSLSYLTSTTEIQGAHPDVMPNIKLWSTFWSVNGSYRKLFRFSPFLLALGSTVAVGKGKAYAGGYNVFEEEFHRDNLSEGMGGGGSIFGEIDYILFTHILIGARFGANILWTETLKYSNGQKWIVSDNGHEINLDYTGATISMRAGFLW